MEQGLKDLKKMLKEKAKKFGVYSPASHISCETALMMIDRIEKLEAELVWAWENMTCLQTNPREGEECDFCSVCNGPEWGHKPGCEALKRKESAELLLGKNFWK